MVSGSRRRLADRLERAVWKRPIGSRTTTWCISISPRPAEESIEREFTERLSSFNVELDINNEAFGLDGALTRAGGWPPGASHPLVFAKVLIPTGYLTGQGFAMSPLLKFS